MEGRYFDDQTARADFLRAALDRQGRVADRTTRVEVVHTEDGPFVVNELMSADVISEDDTYIEKLVFLNHGVFKCGRRIENAQEVGGVCRLCYQGNQNPMLCKDHCLVCKEGNHIVCQEHALVEHDGTVWCEGHRPHAVLLAFKAGVRGAVTWGPPIFALALAAALIAGLVCAAKFVVRLALCLWEPGGTLHF